MATDVSEEMIAVTNKKIAAHASEDSITTRKIDLDEIQSEVFTDKFDLVFSDFGGLNCVSGTSLESLFKTIAGVLNPGGRVILVVMPRFCAWETIYFMSKLNVAKAFRRRKIRVQSASLGSSNVDVWYYNPSQILAMSNPYFRKLHVQPIGIAIPPSYLEKSLLAKENTLKKLDAAERKLNKFRSLSGMADHYLIDLELK